MPTVIEILTSIHNPLTLKRLHISLSSKADSNNENVRRETALLEKYAKLCIEIVSARCWSQCQYTVCLPNCFALVHHAETPERERGMQLVRKIWEAALQAEKTLDDPNLDSDVRACLEETLNHMAWHKSQIARELYLVCEAGHWRHTDQQIRQLAFYLFGTPANTKHFLEDCFAHLADIVKRIARHVKISKSFASYQTNILFTVYLIRSVGHEIKLVFWVIAQKNTELTEVGEILLHDLCTDTKGGKLATVGADAFRLQ